MEKLEVDSEYNIFYEETVEGNVVTRKIFVEEEDGSMHKSQAVWELDFREDVGEFIENEIKLAIAHQVKAEMEYLAELKAKE